MTNNNLTFTWRSGMIIKFIRKALSTSNIWFWNRKGEKCDEVHNFMNNLSIEGGGVIKLRGWEKLKKTINSYFPNCYKGNIKIILYKLAAFWQGKYRVHLSFPAHPTRLQRQKVCTTFCCTEHNRLWRKAWSTCYYESFRCEVTAPF